MTWQPYTPERLASLPDTFVRDQYVWRTIAPLVCFDIVEWHRPDRVLRQFGLHQAIPVHCDTEVKLHSIDRRGRHHYDWRAYHGRYIQLWEAREENIATGEPDGHAMHYHDPYMEWYRNITRRLITPLTQRPHMRIQPSSGMTHLLVRVHRNHYSFLIVFFLFLCWVWLLFNISGIFIFQMAGPELDHYS